MNAEALKAWRQRHGLSQGDAARVLGVKPHTLRGLEIGRPSSLWGAIGRLIECLSDAEIEQYAGRKCRKYRREHDFCVDA